MQKYIIIGVIAAIIALLIIIPRIITAKYSGSTIRIFNKTIRGVAVAYVGKIVSEREQTNIVNYPYVNSVFLCKPSKNAPEKYYTWSSAKKKLYYLESTSPKYEQKNTEKDSKFHEVLITPFDNLVLRYVFRLYG